MWSTVPGARSMSCSPVLLQTWPATTKKKGILCLMLLIQEVAIGALCNTATKSCSRMVQWSIQCAGTTVNVDCLLVKSLKAIPVSKKG